MNGEMKKISVNFVDFWSNFNKTSNMFTGPLSKRFQIEISEKPDFLFFSVFGGEHLKYDCVRIFYTGENFRPDFNVCDYAIGFDWIQFEDRHFRWPLYRNVGNFNSLYSKRDGSQIIKEKDHFCNYIFSNSLADPMREYFFKKLSEYKFVDSMGSHLKNKEFPLLSERKASNWANSKVEVIRPYKFTIAFENSSTSGYTTEKLVHAMQAETIPIYWGNPHIDREFNPESFIWIREKDDVEVAIEKIIQLDNDENKWIEMMNKKWIVNDYIKDNLTQFKFENFLYHIIDQTQIKATRRSKYLWTKNYEKRIANGYDLQKKK